MALVKLNSITSSNIVTVNSIAIANIQKINATEVVSGGIPVDLSVFVGAAIDDGHCVAGGTLFGHNWDSIVVGNFSGNSYYLFFRFTNITIPQGATINSAKVRFTAKSNQSGTTVNANLFFEARDDTITPASGSAVNSAPLTSPAVDWDSIPAWTADLTYDTPSIVAPLQDIIDRVGWEPGNSVVFQVRDDASTASSYRDVSTYDFDPTDPAELIINYDYPFEDLTTFTEVDSASDITVTMDKCDIDTMRNDAVSYVYKDYGASYFDDYDIDFEFLLSASDVDSGFVCMGVSDTIGTRAALDTANDGIVVYPYRTGPGTQRIVMIDFSNDNFDYYQPGGPPTGPWYCSFKRTGTTATLEIYSDYARTSLSDTLSITSTTTAKRYLYVCSSAAAFTAANTVTGYTKDINIITAS